MKRYEFNLAVWKPGFLGFGDGNLDSFLARIDRLGKDGWQLVSAMPATFQQNTTLVFQRELLPTQQQPEAKGE